MKFLFLAFLFWTSIGNCHEFGLIRSSGINLFGYVDPAVKPTLQQGAPSDSGELDLTYMHGESRGIAFGLEAGTKYQGFTQKETSTRPSSAFKSYYNYRGIKLGYWIKQQDGAVLQILYTYGKGTFNFYEIDSNIPEKCISAEMRQLEARGIYPVYEFGGINFDLSAGIRTFKVFTPGFEYKGISYVDDEVSHSKFNITFGIGLRY